MIVTNDGHCSVFKKILNVKAKSWGHEARVGCRGNDTMTFRGTKLNLLEINPTNSIKWNH